jgi:isocitrate/isopropylmalate dehydrogenase
MNLKILIVPGDGIGVEVTREAVKVLRHITEASGHTISLSQGLLGGIAIHKSGGNAKAGARSRRDISRRRRIARVR